MPQLAGVPLLAGVLLLGTTPALRVLIFRYSVPRGHLLRHACPACGAPPLLAASSPTGRCGECRSLTGPAPGQVELATAAVCAGASIVDLALMPVTALAWFSAYGLVLSFVDGAVRRLPDVLTATAAAGTAALLGTAAVESGRTDRMLCAMGAACVLSAFLLLLATVRPDSLGLGDVKYAPTIGLVLGWAGWTQVYAGLLIALGLAAGYGLVRRFAGRSSTLAFGPFLFAGSLLSLVLLLP